MLRWVPPALPYLSKPLAALVVTLMVSLFLPTIVAVANEPVSMGEVTVSEALTPSDQLTPFGYELFDTIRLAPPESLGLVDTTYVIGPQDEFIVHITGAISERHTLTVDAEGRILLPKAGPVYVWGLTLEEARSFIQEKLLEYYVGVDIAVGMGRLRSIDVYVLGEVVRPGQYTVSSLANVMHALIEAGGIPPSGSLRNVQRIRNGVLVETIDLYDLLITGALRTDIRVRDGDVILVPHVGAMAGIAGEVRRPGMYELQSGETLADLIAFAAGFTPAADVRSIRIERVNDEGRRTLEEVALPHRDALANGELAVVVRDGDLVSVPSIDTDRLPSWGNAVRLEGHVFRPGRYQLADGLTVSQLLAQAGGVLGETYMARGEVLRFVSNETRQVLPFDVELALSGDPKHDLLLEEWDIVTIYSMRDVVPVPTVRSVGFVHDPGTYELTPDMRVRDLIFRSKELTDAAYLSRAELFRAHRVGANELREVIVLDLARLLAGDESQNVLLKPDDILMVYGAEDLMHLPLVRISGEVHRTGTFELTKDMRLSDLLARAGGLTAAADPEVARVEIFRRGADGATVLYADVSVAQAAALHAETIDDADNPLLQDGDHVYVRTRFDYAEVRTIELTGAVRYPGRYEFEPGTRLADVIERAGGLIDDAYLYGAVFTRASLVEQQQRFIQDLVQAEMQYIERERARLDDMPLTLDERDRRWRALQHRANVVELMQSRTPQGRIILDVQANDDELTDAVADILLHHGDRLHVPMYPGTVLVAGAVYMPEALLFVPGHDAEYYLRQVGGPLRDADADGMYIIKANGRVETHYTGFSELQAGDAIVVPYRTEMNAAGGVVDAVREEAAR